MGRSRLKSYDATDGLSLQDAGLNPTLYPWELAGQLRTHQQQLVHPAATDPRQRLNQASVMLTDAYTGLEAYDYQNPYVFYSAGFLSTATLVPAYGILGDTPQSVLANIQGPPVLGV